VAMFGQTWSPKPGSLDQDLEVVDGQHAGCTDSFHQLVDSQLSKCDRVPIPFSCRAELANGGRSCWEARWKLKLH
jgi:hypothetical protein